jgi:amino acid permease
MGSSVRLNMKSFRILSHAIGLADRTEYWLASLKVITVVIFIILGILVNVGVNRQHHYVGFHNWGIPGAPFVGGFGGFAKVFVTARLAALHPLFLCN